MFVNMYIQGECLLNSEVTLKSFYNFIVNTCSGIIETQHTGYRYICHQSHSYWVPPKIALALTGAIGSIQN